MRRTGTFVLVLISVLVFAGVAYAGNGNCSGKGNEGGSPGNSADAPGQVKKDAPPPAVETTTVATAPTTTAVAAPGAPANSSGVKPSNETAHDTHAEAQSDKTKQYGNGQTAGQIAEKNGAAGNAVLHGPGNSQPHKLTPCSGGHEVDVHALKSHRGGSCGGPTPTRCRIRCRRRSPDRRSSPRPRTRPRRSRRRRSRTRARSLRKARARAQWPRRPTRPARPRACCRRPSRSATPPRCRSPASGSGSWRCWA
jgi:hypothetical protein